MGCFGIGVSRLLQAVVEHSCSVHGSEGISWPLSITPFTACVLPLTTSPVRVSTIVQINTVLQKQV